MEGCVYILTNVDYPDSVKIGCTYKTAIERLKEINRCSGLRYPCQAEYELRVRYDYEKLEERVHKILLAKWHNKEWFKCNIEDAVKIIREAANELNILNEVFYWVDDAKIKAEFGVADAQTELGYAYYKGYGVVQDYKLAKEWFEKAADQGNAKAQNYLGLIYQNVKKSNSDSLRDTNIPLLTLDEEYDYEQAKMWLKKSAEQNYADGQFNLARFYYEISYFDKSSKEAFKWFEKSALQGNADAQFYLGKMYQNGDGVKTDIEKAKYWYLKAVESDSKIVEKVIESCLGKNSF